MHAIKKRDVEKIQNELINVINPTKKIRDLEQDLEFADTFQNQVNLADAYLENSDFSNAIMHYEQALNDNFDDDFYVCTQLIVAYFESDKFEKVVRLADKIKDNIEFKGERSQFLYGLALDKMGRTDDAISQLLDINKRYSCYNERVIIAKFLMHHNEQDKAKEILNDISDESQHMTSANRKQYNLAISEVQRLLSEI